MSTLFAFLHHLAFVGLVAALCAELVLLGAAITVESARRLQRADMAYGISAGVLLVVGLLRVFYFEKGADYYWHNFAFLAKFGLFIAMGLLSIYPTVKFLSWRADVKAGRAPVLDDATRGALKMVIHIELTAMALMLLLAAMMARGVGAMG